MPRRYFTDGQEIVIEDFNALSKALQREIYDRVAKKLLGDKVDAFFGDSLIVSFASSSTVTVSPGLGFQQDLALSSPEPTFRPLYLDSAEVLAVATPDGSNDRIDIVVVKYSEADEISENRKFKSAIDETISTVSTVVQKDWAVDLQVVTGTPSVSPVAPAVPAGYIKLAEVLVSAVTGIGGSGDVTDTRAKMPVGAEITINTLGYDRLTAAAASSLGDLLAEIDGFIKNGFFEYWDIEELGAEPATPASGRVRAYFKDGVLFLKDDGGVNTPVGSGAGGGGGFQWTEIDGSSPIPDQENGIGVYLYGQAAGHKLTGYLKVPTGFVSGRQILMKVACYSPSSSNAFLMRVAASLIRVNNDPYDTPAASRNSTNVALTNTVAKQYREVTLDITDSSGQIGGFTVQPGDMLKIELSRPTDGSDTDTADVRFLPSTTEVKFG